MVLFCSFAVLDPRVGHTTDVLSPFISVMDDVDNTIDEELYSTTYFASLQECLQ